MSTGIAETDLFVPFKLLAIVEGEFAGMVGATEMTEGQIIELISLWVAPWARGQEVSDLLVKAVISWATEQKALAVALDVRTENKYAKDSTFAMASSTLENPG